MEKLIAFSTRNRWLMMLLTALVSAVGVWALLRLPIDAVPDITNNQVQINTIATALSAHGLSVRRRSLGEWPDATTDVFLADTTGEEGKQGRVSLQRRLVALLVKHFTSAVVDWP